jgi:hypothetical protein
MDDDHRTRYNLCCMVEKFDIRQDFTDYQDYMDICGLIVEVDAFRLNFL